MGTCQFAECHFTDNPCVFVCVCMCVPVCVPVCVHVYVLPCTMYVCVLDVYVCFKTERDSISDPQVIGQ